MDDQPQNGPAVPIKHRRSWKRWVLPPLTVFLALCAGIYVLTATGPGLRIVLGLAEGPIAAALQGSFAAKDVSGSLWSELRIGRLTVSTADGLSLEAQDMRLGWHPLSLLTGQLEVDVVGATHVALSIPEAPPAAPVDDAETTPFSIPSLPVRVLVRQLDFPSVVIDVPDGSRFQASVLGNVATTESSGINTVLDIAATHEGKAVDRATLKAEFQTGDDPEMDLSLSARIPTDGVLFAILDLPADLRRPVTAHVAGRGRLTGWTGDVSVDADRLAGLQGKLGLGVTDTGIRVSFDGAADLHDPVVLGLPAELAGRYDISLPELGVEDDTLSLKDLAVDKDGLAAVTFSGQMAADGSDMSVKGKAVLQPAAAGLTQLPVAFGGAEASFEATAVLPNLNATLILTASDLDGFGNAAAALEGTVKLTGTLDDGLAVQADISANDARWSDAALGQLLGETVTLKAQADIGASFQDFENIVVTIDPVGASLRTSLRLDGAALTAGNVEARLADLTVLEPLLGLVISGAGEVDLADLSVGDDGSISTVFEIRATEFYLIDDQVAGLVGGAPLAAGDLHLTPADGLVVTLHDLRAQAGAATGVISLGPDFGKLSGQVNLKARASALPKEAGLTVEGDAVDVSVRFAGAATQPDADISVSPLGGNVAGTPIQVDKLEAQLRWRSTVPFVTFQGAGAALGVRASAEGGASIGPDGLNVPGVSLTGAGWSAWAKADLPGFALPADGAARIVVSDAAPFAGLAGLAGLGGQATVEARFSAGAGNGTQSVSATVAAGRIAVQPDASGEPIRIDRIELSGTVGDALTLKDINGRLTAQGIAGEGFAFTEVDAVLQGTGDAVEGDVTVKGADPTPLSLSTHVAARFHQDGASEIQISELRLSYDTLENLAAGSARLKAGAGGLLSARLDLSVLSGTITAQYARADNGATLVLDAGSIPFGPLAEMQGQKGVEGMLSAKVDLRQEGGPASGTFTIIASGLRTADLDKDVSLGLTVDGKVADDHVRIAARTSGTGLDKVDIRAGLPVAVSLVTPGATINRTGSLDGVVKAEILLREIWPYLPLPEHAVTGSMTVDMRLGGTVEHPAIQGDAALQNGEYENLVHGTLIKNIQGVVRFRGENFELENLSGQDAYGGSFSIGGNGSLTGAKPTFDITTKLNTLRVANSDAVKADVDADIQTTQNADGMRVQGKALIKRAEVNLGVALPPNISTLDVEDGSAERPKNQEQVEPSRISLDLTVDAPGQIFVRGRGLESEWEGNVRVTGTATQPVVTGGLSARRGRIDVIGKGFTLDQSTIKFFGGDTIDPMLGIRGVHEGDDITVIALLEGPASKPEIKLASQPPLPEDEVLSRLLFGKTAASLGPLEAAQLAASASELTGGGGGLDVLGTIRDFVGVDVLEVDTSGDAAAVKAGTYVADGVFVGAKQGAAPGSSSVTVEVEVTPNISVTTESGQTSSNAGVNFKWDY